MELTVLIKRRVDYLQNISGKLHERVCNTGGTFGISFQKREHVGSSISNSLIDFAF
jgi:hypothetical protein